MRRSRTSQNSVDRLPHRADRIAGQEHLDLILCGQQTMPVERRRLQQGDRCQQIDLFDSVTPAQTPVWQDLPEETRDTLTGLMARLILEHAQISSPAVQTEAGDDH